MELKTWRNWIHDVLRVRAERHWPLYRDCPVRAQTRH